MITTFIGLRSVTVPVYLMYSAQWTMQQLLRCRPQANGTKYGAARLAIVHTRDSLVWPAGLKIRNKEAMSLKKAMALVSSENPVPSRSSERRPR